MEMTTGPKPLVTTIGAWAIHHFWGRAGPGWPARSTALATLGTEI